VHAQGPDLGRYSKIFLHHTSAAGLAAINDTVQGRLECNDDSAHVGV